MEMLPDAAPADVGAKVAVNDALLPALMFIGMVAPLMLNPVPEAVSLGHRQSGVAGVRRVIVCGALLPTDTLP